MGISLPNQNSWLVSCYYISSCGVVEHCHIAAAVGYTEYSVHCTLTCSVLPPSE